MCPAFSPTKHRLVNSLTLSLEEHRRISLYICLNFNLWRKHHNLGFTSIKSRLQSSTYAELLTLRPSNSGFVIPFTLWTSPYAELYMTNYGKTRSLRFKTKLLNLAPLLKIGFLIILAPFDNLLTRQCSLKIQTFEFAWIQNFGFQSFNESCLPEWLCCFKKGAQQSIGFKHFKVKEHFKAKSI